MTVFCAQMSCLWIQVWCHLEEWQTSDKKKILRSLTIGLVGCFSLSHGYPGCLKTGYSSSVWATWLLMSEGEIFRNCFWRLPLVLFPSNTNVIGYIQAHHLELEFANGEASCVLDFTLATLIYYLLIIYYFLTEYLLFSYWESLHIFIRDHRGDNIIKGNRGFLTFWRVLSLLEGLGSLLSFQLLNFPFLFL